MGKRIIFVVFLWMTFSSVYSQKQKCLTAEMHAEMLVSDSAYSHKHARLEKEIDAYASQGQLHKTHAAVRIIPVVFHVVHEGGPENISKAQIEDQIRILNEDYRRKNADTTDTPAPFQNLAADFNIEFRLAQKSPEGKCTEGIVRVFSPLTNNARDNVKALSYWPSDKYLNIWTVKSIKANSAGTVLGYAQLPGGGATTDGVVLRSDVIGTIGTAVTNTFGKKEKGRSATHEIGHWLDLYHTWGDDDGTCKGSDKVDDTPDQESFNTGCSTFPKNDECTKTVNGVMFMNYMDYSDGICMNLFTKGQKQRVDAVLNGIRRTLVSFENNISTGTDGSNGALCPPIPWFAPSVTMICPGNTIFFMDQSYNGAATSWSWSFPGGTPSSSTEQNPTILYNVSGKYDVTLKARNAAGEEVLTRTGLITISGPTANYTASFEDHFEKQTFPGTEWRIINDDNGNTWTHSNSLTAVRDGRVSIENFESNIPKLKDAFITPSVDLTNVSNPVLSFNMAFAKTSKSNTDKLNVYISKDCGASWKNIPPFPKDSASIATAGIIESYFVPNPTQWRKEMLDLLPRLSIGSRDNVRFKFEFENGGGNNIYIDDIRIGSPVADSAKDANFNLSFFPNPTDKDVYLSFNLFDKSDGTLSIYDAMGRAVPGYENRPLPPGEQTYHIESIRDKGMYFVKLVVSGQEYMQKLVVY